MAICTCTVVNIKMVMSNYSESRRRTFLGWKLTAVNSPFLPSSLRKSRISVSDAIISQMSYVKNHMDLVDPDLVIVEVVSVFVRFVKYTVYSCVTS